MSKGLDALKELKETCETHMGRMVYILQEDRFEILEKALKEYELLKEHANKYEANNLDEMMRLIHNGWVYERKENKKERALEILRTKRVQLDTLFSILNCHKEKENSVQLSLYNSCVGLSERKLTQEEYDFLKEVLL